MNLKLPEKPIVRSVAFENTFDAASAECRWLIEQMQQHNYGSEDIFAVHLAMEEAFTNAVKHGNGMDPEKKVKVEYLIWSDKLEITVTDEGSGFNPDLVPDPRYGENLYKTVGRGLLLIRSYMDNTKFNEQGNQIYMLKHKGKQAESKSSGI